MSTKYAHVASLIAAMAAVVGATDLGDFFQRIHDEGSVTTYQCYRNGTTLEPPSSRNFTVLWRSEGQRYNRAQATCTYVLEGDTEEHSIEVSARYRRRKDYGILSGQGASAYLYQLQPPYQNESYYFKEELPSSDVPVFKIYDTDETCTNAKALRDQVCPEPCDLEYVR
uniref:Lipocalin n=1 Tax=Rhipicephalus zambeziensis TaxID=60191 RepID=A0A224Y8K4_9ACAR